MLWGDQQYKLTRFRYGDIGQRIDTDIPNDTLSFGPYTALEVTKDFVVHSVWVGSYFDSSNNLHEYAFYSRSNDTGNTFLGRVRIDTTASVSIYFDFYNYPSLGVDSTGNIFVSYTKATGVNN